jgi:dTDP-4-amino-4,6-dideoxygalactose transaminase
MRLRTIAPAGGFPSPWDLLRTARLYRVSGRDERVKEQLRLVLQILSAAEHVALFSSGKAALYAVLRTLRARNSKPDVLVSAYTCPDVPAAILRAGFRPSLLDLDPATLRLRAETARKEQLEGAAAVVLSNLYGLPDEVSPWTRIAEENPGFTIVDDACQAFQSSSGDERVGARKGTVGIVSFGRGKSLCGIGGGAALFPPSSPLNLPESAPRKDSRTAAARDLAFAAAAWSFERPVLYSLPSAVPAFGLGETKFSTDFPLDELRPIQALAALAQAGHLELEAAARCARARAYESALRDIRGITLPSLARDSVGTALLRFPVILTGREARDTVCERLRRAGLGANPSYPRALDGYEALKDARAADDLGGARAVAERILTLPLHRYVTEHDQAHMLDLIRCAISV